MLAAVVGIIVLAALVTGLAGSRDPVELEPGTPEAAVQSYLDAVVDRDSEAAIGMLGAGSGCTAEDFDNAYVGEDVHVSLREVRILGETARVDVVITTGSGEIIPTEWSEQQTFRLRQTGDEWLLSGTPWPLFECGVMIE